MLVRKGGDYDVVFDGIVVGKIVGTYVQIEDILWFWDRGFFLAGMFWREQD